MWPVPKNWTMMVSPIIFTMRAGHPQNPGIVAKTISLTIYSLRGDSYSIISLRVIRLGLRRWTDVFLVATLSISLAFKFCNWESHITIFFKLNRLIFRSRLDITLSKNHSCSTISQIKKTTKTKLWIYCKCQPNGVLCGRVLSVCTFIRAWAVTFLFNLKMQLPRRDEK